MSKVIPDKLLISVDFGRVRQAWTTQACTGQACTGQERIVDLDFWFASAPHRIGDLILGRVLHKVSGMAAVFVDIGCDQPALLRARDYRSYKPISSSDKIQKKIKKHILPAQGKEILVQLTRLADPEANKGARLTSWIHLSGALLYYRPLDAEWCLLPDLPSAWVTALTPVLDAVRIYTAREALEPAHAALSQIILPLIEETKAENRNLMALVACDCHFLHETWRRIRFDTQKSPNIRGAHVPLLLHPGVGWIDSVLQGLVRGTEIHIDARLSGGLPEQESIPALQQALAARFPADWAKHKWPGHKWPKHKWSGHKWPKHKWSGHKDEFYGCLHWYEGKQSLFTVCGIEESIEALLHPEVLLASGGRLTIESTAALVAIDLDSAEATARWHAGDPTQLARSLNVEAAIEIARQLRLRRLSGAIIIDFLDPGGKTKHHHAAVTALRRALADDPNVTWIGPMNLAGLVALTRQRIGPSLTALLTEACSACQSQGYDAGRRPAAVPAALAALTRLAEVQRNNPEQTPALLVAHNVAAALAGPAQPAYQACAARLGRSISINQAAHLLSGCWEIISIT